VSLGWRLPLEMAILLPVSTFYKSPSSVLYVRAGAGAGAALPGLRDAVCPPHRRVLPSRLVRRTSSLSGKPKASATIPYLIPELALSSPSVRRRMLAAVTVVTQLDTQPLGLALDSTVLSRASATVSLHLTACSRNSPKLPLRYSEGYAKRSLKK
jgi:hypothetical protein